MLEFTINLEGGITPYFTLLTPFLLSMRKRQPVYCRVPNNTTFTFVRLNDNLINVHIVITSSIFLPFFW